MFYNNPMRPRITWVAYVLRALTKIVQCFILGLYTERTTPEKLQKHGSESIKEIIVALRCAVFPLKTCTWTRIQYPHGTKIHHSCSLKGDNVARDLFALLALTGCTPHRTRGYYVSIFTAVSKWQRTAFRVEVLNWTIGVSRKVSLCLDAPSVNSCHVNTPLGAL